MAAAGQGLPVHWPSGTGRPGRPRPGPRPPPALAEHAGPRRGGCCSAADRVAGPGTRTGGAPPHGVVCRFHLSHRGKTAPNQQQIRSIYNA